MNLISSLLGNSSAAIDANDDRLKNITTIIDSVKNVVSAALGIITIIVIGYGIFMAYKFFTADTEDKRKNAKAQLIYAIIGVVVAIALIIMSTVITETIKNSMTTNSNGNTGNTDGSFHIFFPKY